jgi:hypothetical protein
MPPSLIGSTTQNPASLPHLEQLKVLVRESTSRSPARSSVPSGGKRRSGDEERRENGAESHVGPTRLPNLRIALPPAVGDGRY